MLLLLAFELQHLGLGLDRIVGGWYRWIDGWTALTLLLLLSSYGFVISLLTALRCLPGIPYVLVILLIIKFMYDEDLLIGILSQ